MSKEKKYNIFGNRQLTNNAVEHLCTVHSHSAKHNCILQQVKTNTDYTVLTSASFTNSSTFFRLLEERRKSKIRTHAKNSNISIETPRESKHSSDCKCIHRGFNSRINKKPEVFHHRELKQIFYMFVYYYLDNTVKE